MPAGTLYLLDTNVLVAYIRAGPLGRWIESNYLLLKSRDRPVISVVSRGEVYALAKKFSWGPSKTGQLETLLRELVTLDINVDEIVRSYADIDHYSLSVGRTLGKNDVWIAATAAAYRIPILTTDKDFDHLHPEWLEREWIDEEAVT